MAETIQEIIDSQSHTDEFKNLIGLLDEYAKEAKRIVQERLKADGRVATGKLLNSIETNVKVGNLQYTVVLKAEDYLRWTEKGRKPTKNSGDGTVYSNILKWIEAKNIIPRADENGHLPTQKQLAYLITRKIHRQGYEGAESIHSSIDDLNADYLPKLQEALEKDWEAYSIKIFNGLNKGLKVY